MEEEDECQRDYFTNRVKGSEWELVLGSRRSLGHTLPAGDGAERTGESPVS